jgi:DNA (cytosine-5)-methyltransferase 1
MNSSLKAPRTAISLFSGAGGLDIGFRNAGFDVRLAVEQDPSCCDTLRANSLDTKVLQADISKLSGLQLCELAGVAQTKLDCLFGGPPCQSFSLAGQRRGLNDPRGQMLAEFIRLVREIQPKVFVLENVKGMLNWANGEVMRFLESEFDAIEFGNPKYRIAYKVLNASSFGAPQHRERIFVVGNCISKAMTFPEPTHGNEQGKLVFLKRKPFVSVGEALKGLPPVEAPSKVAQRVSQTIRGRIARHGY